MNDSKCRPHKDFLVIFSLAFCVHGSSNAKVVGLIFVDTDAHTCSFIVFAYIQNGKN